ncbi:MAG TPA: hypothetical protein VHV55_26545 [Pirellulales bacterium]|jgi:hypothetical protein|nr:hypothetical protein [Pirellulales bacterium]
MSNAVLLAEASVMGTLAFYFWAHGMIGMLMMLGVIVVHNLRDKRKAAHATGMMNGWAASTATFGGSDPKLAEKQHDIEIQRQRLNALEAEFIGMLEQQRETS